MRVSLKDVCARFGAEALEQAGRFWIDYQERPLRDFAAAAVTAEGVTGALACFVDELGRDLERPYVELEGPTVAECWREMRVLPDLDAPKPGDNPWLRYQPEPTAREVIEAEEERMRAFLRIATTAQPVVWPAGYGPNGEKPRETVTTSTTGNRQAADATGIPPELDAVR